MYTLNDCIQVLEKMQHIKCHHDIKTPCFHAFIIERCFYKLDIIQLALCFSLFSNRQQFTGDINASNLLYMPCKIATLGTGTTTDIQHNILR